MDGRDGENFMKTILMAGAALVALTVGAQAADAYRPGPAAAVLGPQIVGDFSAYGGFGTWGDDKSATYFGGLARASIYLSPNVTAQFDLNAENGFNSGDDKSYSIVNLAAHLDYRTPGYILGLMVSYGYNGWWSDRFATIAAEGLTNLGPLQLYGQIGWTGNTTSSGHAFYGHVEGRYFFGPNLMAAVDVGVAGMEDCCSSGTTVRWGATLRGRLNNSPVGGFIQYQGSHAALGDDTDHTFLIGATLNFNTMTLQQSTQALPGVDLNPFTGVNHVRFFD